MEEAQKNFIFGNMEEAIKGFSKVVESKPEQPDPYLCRAIVYMEVAQYDLAFQDLEKANKLRPSHYQTNLRLGMVQFFKQSFVPALSAFKTAESLATKEHEKATVSSWIQKCARELGNSSSATLNSMAQMPKPITAAKSAEEAKKDSGLGKKVEYDWYQSSTHVYVSLKIKGMSKEKCKVAFAEQDFTLDINLGDNKTYEYSYDLHSEIVPESSTFTVSDTKVEVKLKKKTEGIQWPAVERAAGEGGKGIDRPSYPTSAKKKIDWEKLDKEVEKETAKDKPEGDEALSGLFKAIYEYGKVMLISCCVVMRTKIREGL